MEERLSSSMAVFFDETRIVKGHCRTNSRMPAHPLSLTRLRPFTPSAKASGFQFILDVSALKIAKTRRETMRQRSQHAAASHQPSTQTVKDELLSCDISKGVRLVEGMI